MADDKSPVRVLQKLVEKLRGTVEFECVCQLGIQHRPVFRFRCKALGERVIGSGRSKKEAKQSVARLMLEILSSNGYPVPTEFESHNANSGKYVDTTKDYVILLNELIIQFNLDPVVYVLLLDGEIMHVPNQPVFTVKATTGHFIRVATAATKHMAYQFAAAKLYMHLRGRFGIDYEFSDEHFFRAYKRASRGSDLTEETTEELRRVLEEDDNLMDSQEPWKKNKKRNNSVASVVHESMELELTGDDPVDLPVNPPEQSNMVVLAGPSNATLSFLERTLERLGL